MAFPVKHVECKSNDRFWSSQKIIDCEITFDKQSTWGKSVLAISLYKRSTFSKVDPWRLQSWISVKLQQWKQNSPENLPTMTMGFRNFIRPIDFTIFYYYMHFRHDMSYIPLILLLKNTKLDIPCWISIFISIPLVSFRSSSKASLALASGWFCSPDKTRCFVIGVHRFLVGGFNPSE